MFYLKYKLYNWSLNAATNLKLVFFSLLTKYCKYYMQDLLQVQSGVICLSPRESKWYWAFNPDQSCYVPDF